MSKTKKKFYVTTPIYYVNASPHLGGAYTTIAADVLARWHRILGEEVYFLTGTDEHGQKIQEAAKNAGKEPKDFVDSIAKEFKDAFSLLEISNNYFIRTTDQNHEKYVKEVLQRLYDQKDIYKGFYEANYCIGCEQYKTDSELIEGKCPLHNRAVELRKEEAYLFKLSKFQDKILKAIESDKLEIRPEDRKKEILDFIRTGLKDISISRLKEKISWGIPLPFDKNHTCFVWVDAFWNYVSGLNGNSNEEKFWPADVQLMAKDIIRVHATIWPAILLALKRELPKKIFVHGYFTIDGQKMSKSLGNVISPIDLVKKYDSDCVRYYLMRSISFGSDGDVSEKALIERNNNELANKFGNLVSRISSLSEIYGIKETKLKLKIDLKKINELFENLEIDKILNEIFLFIDKLNEYTQNEKPWVTKDAKVLYEVLSGIRDITILLSPFIPGTCEKIARHFGFNISIEEVGKKLDLKEIKKAPIFFKKIELLEETKKPNLNKAEEPKEIMEGITSIEFSDFEKIDLRVGKILTADDIEGADKLWKLSVDLGKEKRTICAGIKAFYKKEDLINKSVIVLTNLKPRKLRGINSEGMLLAAGNKETNTCALLVPDKTMEPGCKIS